MSAARRLRQIRNEHKLSQQDIARLANLPKTAISKIEHGTRQLSADEAMALSVALGITPNQFYGIDALPPRKPCVKRHLVERVVKQIQTSLDDLSQAYEM
jgi:transcriptional regulator with XRE-family HTH domain